MPWPDAALRFILLLLTSTLGPPYVQSEGNVGCLFSERLCLEDTEWCYDDYAFGRCLPVAGQVDEDDFYRFNLEKNLLHDLSHELRRLFALGYRWSHVYTQCRLQGMLFSTKNEMPYETNACSHLSDQDLEGALKALEGQDQLDPREVAVVKYTPSAENPHADYADEIYYPPIDSETQAIRDIIMPENAVDLYDMKDPYAEFHVDKRAWIPQMHRRSIPIFTQNYNTPTNFRQGKETRDTLEFLPYDDEAEPVPETAEPTTEREFADLFFPVMRLLDKMRRESYPEDYTPRLPELLRDFEQMERQQDVNMDDVLSNAIPPNYAYEDEQDEDVNEEDEEEYPKRFTFSYNTPDNFRAGWESRDLDEMGDQLPESRIYIDESPPPEGQSEEYGSGAHNQQQQEQEEIFRELKKQNHLLDPQEIFRELKNMQDFYQPETEAEAEPEAEAEELVHQRKSAAHRPAQQPPGFYAEGGLLYIPKSDDDSSKSEPGNGDLNEFVDKYSSGFKRPERLDVKKPGPPFDGQITTDSPPKNLALDRRPQLSSDDVLLPSMMKKEPRGPHPNPIHELYDVDTDYVYVSFKESINTWEEGDYIIKNISRLLNLEGNVFNQGRVDRNEVTFKVGPNRWGINALQVSKKIGQITDKLKAATGVEITAVGVGDKVRMQTVHTTRSDSQTEFYIIVLTICGALVAMIISSALLIVIRRNVASKEKLQGISRPDSEASKDYQDLCRARMATKGQQPNDAVHGRITSLSRESEQSQSSRSSTSSWSEEPALHNMDISTGHMVLSYMEDHLKNKDRLEQEWVALCAYVAEPSETSFALQSENVGKNRYPDVLPYDHSRVVLNELTNAAGSDYINASSITDHDPRNPAYIATQGPLPHTAPDFWQLIWEQGAVVIVMLSRLTEGGAAMCHRYWPEEGSELYHIYEVHLVSEHIWCDDYLVRSFYLKNARTGETRTVTQFHFLSWPEAGVPASTKALLEFRRKVNKSYRGRSCPIVVHCSDGAGRTGTYCLIDMVLSRMAKGAKEIDIAATLEHLRDQRSRMVATKQQFEFVLTAVAEEVHAILKALPPQPTPTAEKEKQ